MDPEQKKEAVFLQPESVVSQDGQPEKKRILIGGRYELLEELGRGGMATVYKARHTEIQKLVAVKILNADLSDPVAYKRFQMEAKSAAALNHVNALSVSDFGRCEDGRAYLVMDYIEGRSLAQIISSEGPLPANRVIDIFQQVARGLQYAHEQGVVHRDLKSANIMISRDSTTGGDVAKVVDFGLARKENEEPVTRTGEVFGTPQYMSPEQCLGHKADARSDLYSLGCAMYEALSGKPPFEAETAVALALKQVNERPPSFSQINPAAPVSSQLESVVMTLLEKDPADRYQSANDLAADLRTTAKGGNLTNAQGRRLRRRGQMPLIVVAAAIFLAVGAMAVWKWYQTTPQYHLQVLEQSMQKTTNIFQRADFLVRIGDIKRGFGDGPGAERAYREALDIMVTTRSFQSNTYLDAIARLASLYRSRGDIDRATELYSFNIRLSVTRAQEWNGQYPAEALELWKRLLAVTEATLGKGDVSTGLRLRDLACSYMLNNDPDQAAKLLRQVISQYEDTFGPQSIETGMTWKLLGEAEYHRHHYAEAAECFKKALPILRKDKLSFYALRNTLDFLGRTYAKLGDAKQAADLAKEAAEINHGKR